MDTRYSADWFSLHAANWLRLLGPLSGLPSLLFLEIGCFEGRATAWLLENILTHPSARIVCIDTFGGSFEHREMGLDMGGVEARFDHNIRAIGAEGKVRKIKGSSGGRLRGLELGAYDFAYVDGSHLARDVLEDAVLSFRLLKRGGMMIFDDYLWDHLQGDPQHPKVGIDAFLNAYRPALHVVQMGYQVVVRKA